MARILITGIAGFLGRNLERYMASEGHEVYGTTTGRPNKPNYRQCDITDEETVRRVINDIQPEILVHCAAQSSVTVGSVENYYRINVVGTQQILDALLAVPNFSRMVLVSTAGVYGNQPVEILAEDLPPMPVHHYGLSKFAAEQIAKNYRDRMNITIVRPFNIVGPGQAAHFIVPKLSDAFAAGDKQIRLGNIDVYRDYIDVIGASEILSRLCFAPAASQTTVNLCSGRGTSLRELISLMEELAGYRMEVIPAPEFTRKAEVWKLLGSNALLSTLLPSPGFGRPLRTVVSEILDNKRLDASLA